jgi:hypothetical protein
MKFHFRKLFRIQCRLPPAALEYETLRARRADRFAHGRSCITDAAVKVLDSDEAALGLLRHGSGDWGDVTPDECARNECALRDGGALRSVFATASGRVFWVTTDAAHTDTWVALPGER